MGNDQNVYQYNMKKIKKETDVVVMLCQQLTLINGVN